jgi:hypothetical protein
MSNFKISVDLAKFKPDLFPMLLDLGDNVIQLVQDAYPQLDRKEQVVVAREILVSELQKLASKAAVEI